MINIYLENNTIVLEDIVYNFTNVELIDNVCVSVNLYNDIYNTIYVFVANDLTINGVLQTSGQMIFDTLNGQS